MGPVVWAEVKRKVDELLKLDFVAPSIPPLGAPTLLARKKDVS